MYILLLIFGIKTMVSKTNGKLTDQQRWCSSDVFIKPRIRAQYGKSAISNVIIAISSAAQLFTPGSKLAFIVNE